MRAHAVKELKDTKKRSPARRFFSRKAVYLAALIEKIQTVFEARSAPLFIYLFKFHFASYVERTFTFGRGRARKTRGRLCRITSQRSGFSIYPVKDGELRNARAASRTMAMDTPKARSLFSPLVFFLSPLPLSVLFSPGRSSIGKLAQVARAAFFQNRKLALAARKFKWEKSNSAGEHPISFLIGPLLSLWPAVSARTRAPYSPLLYCK